MKKMQKIFRINGKHKDFIITGIAVICSMLLVSCTNAPAISAVSSTATVTQTPTVTVTLTPQPTQTPTITPTPTPVLTIGSTQVSSVDGMLMVYVPEGDFSMGSNEHTGNSAIHTVTLDAYWIDQTELTNGMYQKCVEDGKCSNPANNSSPTRSSYFGNSDFDDYPVIYVNWDQANEYCQWAGRRLPTEAEWEKAAKGTTDQIYPWGNNEPNSNLVNFDLNVGDTTQVGSYPDGVSPYGALDMAGNVWEWVADYGASYPPESVTNPKGPSTGEGRVLRGGSWVIVARNLPTTFRIWSDPTYTDFSMGFRCAMSTNVTP
jgi:formylglycine-generating enzyme required for sulfatase activity